MFFFFFKKVRNWILSVPREKKSPSLHQYQSYISNWYLHQWKGLHQNYTMETQIFYFFQKSSKLNFNLCQRTEITLLRQYQSYISNWYINGQVFISMVATTTWKPKKLNLFPKKFEIEFWLVPEELKSRWLHQYQSYNSKWYPINIQVGLNVHL